MKPIENSWTTGNRQPHGSMDEVKEDITDRTYKAWRLQRWDAENWNNRP